MTCCKNCSRRITKLEEGMDTINRVMYLEHFDGMVKLLAELRKKEVKKRFKFSKRK